MKIQKRVLGYVVLAAFALGAGLPGSAAELDIARIYIEYNSSGNDLGFHVFLDGEDWRMLKIFSPTGKHIFDVSGKAGYKDLGMTELFFEGAEPSLDDFPLSELLALFPAGEYTFAGVTVDGEEISGTATLSHAVPAGPVVSAAVNADVVISWIAVSSPPAGFPAVPVVVVAYQIIAGSFQVTLPASAASVTLPPEFVETLAPGVYPFEVLAIDASGNQTITEGSFSIVEQGS